MKDAYLTNRNKIILLIKILENKVLIKVYYSCSNDFIKNC